MIRFRAAGALWQLTDSRLRSPSCGLGDLATVQWRILPVTWEDITEAPDDVVAGIMATPAA